MRLLRYTSTLGIIVAASTALACSSAAPGESEDAPIDEPSVGESGPSAEMADREDSMEKPRAEVDPPSAVVEDTAAVRQEPPSASEPESKQPVDVATPDAEDGPDEEAIREFALVKGSITNSGAAMTRHGLGGAGLLASARSVRFSVLVDGGLDAISEAAVDSAGRFTAELPLDLDLVVAQVMDGAGDVIGAALVGGTGHVVGGVMTVAPVSLETSLEARVLQRAAGCHHSKGGAGLLALDVAAAVDAELAASVATAVTAGADLDLLVDALANAVAASARARIKALIDAGVDLDIDALLKAKLDALATLNANLVAALDGTKSPIQVTAELLAAVDACLAVAARGNLSADLKVRAHAAASLAFSAALSASLAGVAHIDAVVFAAAHAAAKLEAAVGAQAIIDLVALAGGSRASIDAVAMARAKFVADIEAAADLQGINRARLDFAAAMSNGSQHAGGILGDVLVGATGTLQGVLGSVLDVVADLKAELDAQLETQLRSMVDLNLCLDESASVDADLKLGALVRALADFSADIEALVPSLQDGTTVHVAADALARLLASTELLLRVEV